MKVIIAGSRTITDPLVVEKVMFDIGKYQLHGADWTEVVCGMARGVDMLGRGWAITHKLPVKEFPADWARYEKKAGYVRNQEMARYADALVAIGDGSSTGTKHIIEFMKKLGK